MSRRQASGSVSHFIPVAFYCYAICVRLCAVLSVQYDVAYFDGLCDSSYERMNIRDSIDGINIRRRGQKAARSVS